MAGPTVSPQAETADAGAPDNREVARLRSELRRHAEALAVLERALEERDAQAARPYLDQAMIDSYEGRLAGSDAEIEDSRRRAAEAEEARAAAEAEADALRAEVTRLHHHVAALSQPPPPWSVRIPRALLRRARRLVRSRRG